MVLPYSSFLGSVGIPTKLKKLAWGHRHPMGVAWRLGASQFGSILSKSHNNRLVPGDQARFGRLSYVHDYLF